MQVSDPTSSGMLPASPQWVKGVVCDRKVTHDSSAGSVLVGEGLPSL